MLRDSCIFNDFQNVWGICHVCVFKIIWRLQPRANKRTKWIFTICRQIWRWWRWANISSTMTMEWVHSLGIKWVLLVGSTAMDLSTFIFVMRMVSSWYCMHAGSLSPTATLSKSPLPSSIGMPALFDRIFSDIYHDVLNRHIEQCVYLYNK